MDNPWETDEDRLETLRQMFLIPKPYILELFSLTLYPGTPLSERAIAEGMISDERAQVYRKDYHAMNRTYLNALYWLFQVQDVPHWAIRLLMSAPARRLNWIWIPPCVAKVFRILAPLHRGMERLRHGDWLSVRRAILRRVSRLGLWPRGDLPKCDRAP